MKRKCTEEKLHLQLQDLQREGMGCVILQDDTQAFASTNWIPFMFISVYILYLVRSTMQTVLKSFYCMCVVI